MDDLTQNEIKKATQFGIEKLVHYLVNDVYQLPENAENGGIAKLAQEYPIVGIMAGFSPDADYVSIMNDYLQNSQVTVGEDNRRIKIQSNGNNVTYTMYLFDNNSEGFQKQVNAMKYTINMANTEKELTHKFENQYGILITKLG